MKDVFEYNRGDELPGINLPWQEETAANVFTNLDLSSGYTFTATLTNIATGTVAPSVTPSILGYNGGVTVNWAIDDLDLAAGQYNLELIATETSSGKARTWRRGNLPIVQIIDG